MRKFVVEARTNSTTSDWKASGARFVQSVRSEKQKELNKFNGQLGWMKYRISSC